LQRWCGIDFAHYTPRKIECNRFVNEKRPSHDGLAKEEELRTVYIKGFGEEVFEILSLFLPLKQVRSHQLNKDQQNVYHIHRLLSIESADNSRIEANS
jgi:hypothetical protein